jgi:hypothetical protein
LRVLRYARLVQTRKEGKFVIYSLDSELADKNVAVTDAKRLDLGCCRLDLVERISTK